MINKWQQLALALIIAGGFACRLYRINYPLMDWHSFRQADTASVTLEFVRHHYPIWLPHYHDLGNVQSGLDNPEGYRMVEFPLVNWLLAWVLRVFTAWDVVVVSRLAAAIVSSASIWLVYRLLQNLMTPEKDIKTKQTAGSQMARETVPLLAAAALAFIPYGVYYGRTVLPEPFQVFLILATLVAWDEYLRLDKWWQWTLVWLCLAAALLVKPTSIFVAPALVALAICRRGWKCVFDWRLIVLAVLAVAPLMWWRRFILNFPEGIPQSDWLLNGVVYEIDPVWGVQNEVQPRWRPLWWRWMFYERLAKMILGGAGMVFALAGLIPERWRWRKKFWCVEFTCSDWLVYAWGAGIFAYLATFATGNIRHDYYQYLMIGWVAIVVGRGIYKSIQLGHELDKKQRLKGIFRFWPEAAAVMLVAGALWYGWRQNGSKFDVHNWAQVRIGAVARERLPEEALVIAHAFDGDTNFLFQTRKRGWPSGLNLDEKIAAGAQYLVGTDTDDLYHFLREHYALIYKDDDGFIFSLLEASESGIMRDDI